MNYEKTKSTDKEARKMARTDMRGLYISPFFIPNEGMSVIFQFGHILRGQEWDQDMSEEENRWWTSNEEVTIIWSAPVKGTLYKKDYGVLLNGYSGDVSTRFAGWNDEFGMYLRYKDDGLEQAHCMKIWAAWE